jgi:hypothetical protein
MTPSRGGAVERMTAERINQFRKEWDAAGPDEPEWLQQEIEVLNFICDAGIARLSESDAIRNTALEEAAEVCEESISTGQLGKVAAQLCQGTSQALAQRIRALKTAAPAAAQPVAWIATKDGQVLHFAQVDGWRVETVMTAAAQIAHSKSEYKRRVAQGDDAVLPPAVRVAAPQVVAQVERRAEHRRKAVAGIESRQPTHVAPRSSTAAPSMDEVQLACGNLTASEFHAVKAALEWFVRRLNGEPRT